MKVVVIGMQHKKSGSSFFLRLMKGEDLLETLTSFIRKNGITAGTISGIGAVDQLTLGYYDINSKSYQKKDFNEFLEILNLSGNISILDQEPFPHVHIIAGRANYETIGGHLIYAQVGLTAEIHILAADTLIKRQYDKESGLNLLNLV